MGSYSWERFRSWRICSVRTRLMVSTKLDCPQAFPRRRLALWEWGVFPEPCLAQWYWYLKAPGSCARSEAYWAFPASLVKKSVEGLKFCEDPLLKVVHLRKAMWGNVSLKSLFSLLMQRMRCTVLLRSKSQVNLWFCMTKNGQSVTTAIG